MRTMSFVLAMLLLPAAAHAGKNDEEANNRREWKKQYDFNKDGRLKGKDARKFRKEKEQPFESLMKFCDRAESSPKKAGVKFPKGEKEKSFKCKKGRIDAPYLKAWIAAAEPEPEPDLHPTERPEEDETEDKDKGKGKK